MTKVLSLALLALFTSALVAASNAGSEPTTEAQKKEAAANVEDAAKKTTAEADDAAKKKAEAEAGK